VEPVRVDETILATDEFIVLFTYIFANVRNFLQNRWKNKSRELKRIFEKNATVRQLNNLPRKK
jgi:hypothetical protein